MVDEEVLLQLDGVEVVYNRLMLVLKHVSLRVRRGEIVALLGGNGAGKTTLLRAVSRLLAGERGQVTQGSIRYDGACTAAWGPQDMVRRGLIQVMEGRRCFAHLSLEDNLRLGAYTRRDGRAAQQHDLEKVYAYFPQLKARRKALAAHTSGGEQQMCAIGRALMARPRMILLDEPSMGLAPQVVEEVLAIVTTLNAQEKVSFLLAEQNANLGLRHAHRGYVLESGRVVAEGEARTLLSSEELRASYLGL